MKINRFRRSYNIDITDDNVKGLITRLERGLIRKDKEIAERKAKLKEVGRLSKSRKLRLTNAEKKITSLETDIERKEKAEAINAHEVRSLQRRLAESERNRRQVSQDLANKEAETKEIFGELASAMNRIEKLEEELRETKKHLSPYTRLQKAHKELHQSYQLCVAEMEEKVEGYHHAVASAKEAHGKLSAQIEKTRDAERKYSELRSHLNRLKQVKK